jgi:DNA-binding MarR family transcriptional regulator
MKTPSAQARIDMIARECIGMQLRLLNRVVTKVYDDALRPLRLKTSQVNILVAAWKLGLASPLRVCDILQMDPSTLSRNLERMRAKGWLEVVSSSDGREQPFRLTATGQKLLEKAVPRWESAQQRVQQLLGPSGVDLLQKTLKRLRQSRGSV